MSDEEAAQIGRLLSELQTEITDARRERDEARRMLGECYVLSGADTDGDGWEHTWRHAVSEVRTLREQYDEMVRAACPRCGSEG